MKLEIAICDDEKDFAEKLWNEVEFVLKNGGYEYSLKTFKDAVELLEYCEDNTIDIVLSDIDMPYINGFEMKERLQKICSDAYVIFVTSHEELAYQAYKSTNRPYWFVSKKDINMLDEELTELADKIIREKTKPEIVHILLDKPLGIDTGEVMYFEIYKNYISFHYMNGEVMKVRGKLNDAYKQLKEHGFILVQKSYVVNYRFIRNFDRTEIVLVNGEKITVTRDTQKVKEAQKEYMRFIRS